MLLALAPAIRIIAAAIVARLVLLRARPAGGGSQALVANERATRLGSLMSLVPAPPSKAIGGERLCETDFVRFLHVCRWDVDAAAAMLRADLAWRRTAKPRALRYKGATTGIRGWSVLERSSRQLHMPVTLVTTRAWRPAHTSALRWRSVEENMRHINFFMEEMVRRMPRRPRGVTGAIMMLDMTGFKTSLLVPYVRDGVALCQKHYPCRLGAVVAFNLPSYFPLIWRIVSPWFNDDIRSKIVFPPRHLKDASEVLDWLDERERRRQKPFALQFAQLESFSVAKS